MATDKTCIICRDPADGEITGTIGEKSGAVCRDCAEWCDGNITPRSKRNVAILDQHSIANSRIGGRVFARMDFVGPNGARGYQISDVSEWSLKQVLEWLGY